MIYLITGTPGAGKTLYAVSTLVQKLAAEKIEKNGLEINRRVLVDGIPNLLLPHEVMSPLTEDEKGNLICKDGDSLLTWPSWCKPGDILVVDEVQRYWRPRGMGTKPPEMIKALETHRHHGVDFVIITQNPMLIDQNVRRLVGRHQHVRRLFGMKRAVIYDWDGCSVDVHRTKGATTTFFNYPKSAYDLYKSSELHTKQQQKIPLWLAVPVIALIGGIAIAPQAIATLSGAATGKGIASAKPAASSPFAAASSAHPSPNFAQYPITPSSGAIMARSGLPQNPASSASSPKEQISGCFRFADKCSCLDSSGKPLETEFDICVAKILGFAKPGQKVLNENQLSIAEPISSPYPESDTKLASFVHEKRIR